MSKTRRGSALARRSGIKKESNKEQEGPHSWGKKRGEKGGKKG